MCGRLASSADERLRNHDCIALHFFCRETVVLSK
jgi:hypothetical protein